MDMYWKYKPVIGVNHDWVIFMNKYDFRQLGGTSGYNELSKVEYLPIRVSLKGAHIYPGN